jgi:hypothetical protein
MEIDKDQYNAIALILIFKTQRGGRGRGGEEGPIQIVMSIFTCLQYYLHASYKPIGSV